MKEKNNHSEKGSSDEFIEGVDYYFENNLMILTAHFLEKRGFCCGNGCRHCPYSKSKAVRSKKINS